MTKIQMPEPAIFNASGVGGVIYSHGYTATQMEAYKDACVREALEGAEKELESLYTEALRARVSEDDDDESWNLICLSQARAISQAQLRIRALIPTTKAADYAVAKARGAQQWQPIETAPKSGRSILLGFVNSHGNWRTMLGRWISKEEILNEWEDGDLFDEGWYEISVEADDVPNCWLTNPSHWMPLPPPPTK